MLPRSLRLKLRGDIYIYERQFEDEAARSSNSYLTDEGCYVPPPEASREEILDFKVSKVFKRLIKMQNEECSICMIPLGQEEATAQTSHHQ